MKLNEETEIVVYSGVVDLRKGASGLMCLVGEIDLGCVYLFSNRSRNLLKYLQLDRYGVSTGTRRLKRGHFLWPESHDGRERLQAEELEYLINGQSVKKFRVERFLSGKES